MSEPGVCAHRRPPGACEGACLRMHAQAAFAGDVAEVRTCHGCMPLGRLRCATPSTVTYACVPEVQPCYDEDGRQHKGADAAPGGDACLRIHGSCRDLLAVVGNCIMASADGLWTICICLAGVGDGMHYCMHV